MNKKLKKLSNKKALKKLRNVVKSSRVKVHRKEKKVMSVDFTKRTK